MDMTIRKIIRDFVAWQIRKGLVDELTIDYEMAETYLEAIEVVNKNDLLAGVSNLFICVDAKHYKGITIGKVYAKIDKPWYEKGRFMLIENDKGDSGAYFRSCFKQINYY